MSAGQKTAGDHMSFVSSPQERERERLAKREQYIHSVRVSLQKLWENIDSENVDSISEIQWLLEEVKSVVGTNVAKYEIFQFALENKLEPSDVDNMYIFLGFKKIADDIEYSQSTSNFSTVKLLEIIQELTGSISDIEISDIDQLQDSNNPPFEEMSTDELEKMFQFVYQDLLSEFAVLEASLQNQMG